MGKIVSFLKVIDQGKTVFPVKFVILTHQV